jgi:hypothetical protein
MNALFAFFAAAILYVFCNFNIVGLVLV